MLAYHILEYLKELRLNLGGLLEFILFYLIPKLIKYFLGGINTDIGRNKKLLELIKKIFIDLNKFFKKIINLTDYCIFGFYQFFL